MTRTRSLGGSRGAVLLGGALLLLGACGGGSGVPVTGSGGAPGSGGGNATGGSMSSGGATGTGGGASPTGGASSTGGSAAGGGNAAGGNGTGGGGNWECTRELLKEFLENYFTALADHAPATLSLAATVKFTENGEESEIGTNGLWIDAGAVVHSHAAVDLDECTIAAHAVVPEGNDELPVAVRLKVEAGELTEIETIVARDGDYAAVPSNPNAIVSAAATVGWETPVPEDERPTREELIAWMDKYFRQFPAGVCDVTDDCIRLENGGGNFTCGGLGATCNPNPPGPNDENLPPRLILADVELGIGVGLTIYQGHTDMHMFKRYGGSVYSVQAILSHSDGMSGWD